MKKVAKKYTIYLTIGIISVFAVIIGGTYAIFRKITIQNTTNIMSTLDCINISITGNNSALSLNNSYPLTDTEGLKQTPYRFTVKNNCDTYVEYQIVMSVVNTSNITNKDYVKVDIDGIKSNRKKKISELIEEPQQGLPGYLNNYTLINNSFESSVSHVYNFRMWLNGENEAIWNDNTIVNQSLTVNYQ